MHIKWISIDETPPLQHATFECNERVNLFIGPNASGKSTILRAMNGLYSLADGASYLDPDYYDLVDNELSYSQSEGAHIYLAASDGWQQDDWGKVPHLYIPAARINLPAQDIFSHRIDKSDMVQSDYLLGDFDDPMGHLFDTDSGIFKGEYVKLTIEEIRRNLDEDQALQYQFRNALQVGYSCAKSICPEVIYDDALHSYVELDSDTGRVFHYGMGIVTRDNIWGEALYAGALSSGTQGTLLWVWALALKMASHYEWTEGWQEKPAILLIDEIENHLHPTWQRRVIPALLEHFPKLQIFATTHSPFVVAGLKAGQVHLLKRDEETARVTATTDDHNIFGWTMDEILRTMMGVYDPTDDATAEAAAELRQLRNEWPRSSPEDEEKRQERIAELRQKVDRDLLAGGPWKRRREEFAERFQAALEKHGLPLDLGQENG